MGLSFALTFALSGAFLRLALALSLALAFSFGRRQEAFGFLDIEQVLASVQVGNEGSLLICWTVGWRCVVVIKILSLTWSWPLLSNVYSVYNPPF